MSPKRKTPDLPYDGYIRISRVAGRGGDSFISPDVQRETIERLAAFHGLELGEVVEELDISGGKAIEARELGRLARKVKDGESGGLLVWKVSRFSRNLADGATVADEIRQAGGRIIGEDLDSAQPMGRAILGFLLGWAEEERDARRAGWREAQVRAAARGVHPSRTPVGYMRDEAGRLLPDQKVAPVVARLFELRAEGRSLQECADVLERATGKGWSRSTIKQLFTSQTYLGRIVIGDDIYKEAAHPAIVDERTWQLAQRKNPRPRHDGSLAGQGVLVGLIRCAGCGDPLQVTASGLPDTRVANYTCRRKKASRVCPAPAAALVEKVDALVLPELDRRADSEADQETVRAEVEATSTTLDAAEAELDAFLEAALVGELGRDRYAREVARRRVAVEVATEAHLAAANALQDLYGQEFAWVDGGAVQLRRGESRRHIESATLRKSTNGRWDKIEDRLEVVWR